jgi:hypothetical protein
MDIADTAASISERRTAALTREWAMELLFTLMIIESPYSHAGRLKWSASPRGQRIAGDDMRLVCRKKGIVVSAQHS